MTEALDFRALERESYGLDSHKPAEIQITPELIGRLLACIRQVYGSDPYEPVPADYFERLLLQSTRPIPERIARNLHVERRVDGEHLEELTRITVGPQTTGIASRVNPDNVSLISKTDRLQSYALLEHFATVFPDEVAWLKELLTPNADPQRGQHNGRSSKAT